MEPDPIRKKILYVITKSERGGAQTHVLDLLRSSRQRYHVGLAVGEAGFLVDAAQTLGITVFPLAHMQAPLHPLRDVSALKELSAAYIPHPLSALQTFES